MYWHIGKNAQAWQHTTHGNVKIVLNSQKGPLLTLRQIISAISTFNTLPYLMVFWNIWRVICWFSKIMTLCPAIWQQKACFPATDDFPRMRFVRRSFISPYKCNSREIYSVARNIIVAWVNYVGLGELTASLAAGGRVSGWALRGGVYCTAVLNFSV